MTDRGTYIYGERLEDGQRFIQGTLLHILSMIYTEATLCEVHRFTTLVPLSVYKSTMAETSKQLEDFIQQFHNLIS